MTAPTVLIVLIVGLVAGLAGLGGLVEFAESRRRIRWAHTLARFCGDPACRVCRSRRLSREIPRQVPGHPARLIGG